MSMVFRSAMRAHTLGLFASIALATAGSGSLLAQGDLAPSAGTPQPSMKTLDQVEPRFLINSLPFTISEPGSYYLTRHLVYDGGDAITISTNNVTIDLNGFTLRATAVGSNKNAITASGGYDHITVKNGAINGFTNGISLEGTNNLVVREVVFGSSNNFIMSHGVKLTSCGSVQVTGCTFDNVGDGVDATDSHTISVAHCTLVRMNGGLVFVDSDSIAITGIQIESPTSGVSLTRCKNVVVESSSILRPTNYGVYMRDCVNTVIRNVTVDGSRLGGIVYQVHNSDYGRGLVIENCSVTNDDRAGFRLEGVSAPIIGGRIEGNVATNNGTPSENNNSGFYFTNLHGFYIADNTATGNGEEGFVVTFSCEGSLFVRNHASHNIRNFELTSNSNVGKGPIVMISGELGTSSPDIHPWANFSGPEIEVEP